MKQATRERQQLLRNKPHGYENKDLAIKTSLFTQREFSKAKNVLFYVSTGNEVDTRKMILDCLTTKNIYVPYVQENEMKFSQIRSLNDLEKGIYGILEPKQKKDEGVALDVVIVPGVAFDEEGNRIGYGKGYYDKFLKNTKAKTIALAYEAQIEDAVTCDEHDVPVQKIITERRVIECQNAKY